MTGFDDTPMDDGVREAAVAWLVRVQSDAATADDWAALTDWLDASEAHREAFDDVEAISLELDALAPEIAAGLIRPTAEILPFRPRPTFRPAPARTWTRSTLAAGVAALSLMVGFGVWRASEGDLQVYRTGPGESRAITLADGSHVRLDAASTLAVRQGWFARRAQLDNSEASFDVAHDESRPFEILANDQKIRVIGTEFNVRSYDGEVNVTVRRGIVAVFQQKLGDQPIARLTKGWALQHTVGSMQSIRSPVDPDNAFAWTQGRLICDEQPLSEIVPYLNRRYATQIRITPNLAGRRFSGVLELGDEKEVVRHLAAYLSLSVRSSDRDISLS